VFVLIKRVLTCRGLRWIVSGKTCPRRLLRMKLCWQSWSRDCFEIRRCWRKLTRKQSERHNVFCPGWRSWMSQSLLTVLLRMLWSKHLLSSGLHLLCWMISRTLVESLNKSVTIVEIANRFSCVLCCRVSLSLDKITLIFLV